MPDVKEEGLLRPRRAEEFKGVFKFLDKNNDGSLTKDEFRYLMDAMKNDCSDAELQELIDDLQPGGDGQVDIKHFLHFCAQQLQLDPREELRETWKVVSRLTQEGKGNLPTKGGPSDFTHGAFSPTDLVEMLLALGEEIQYEEAEELIAQADKGNKDYCDFEEFIQLLNVPAGGEQKAKSGR
jgi:Ca2+-binding EF-hand superfamily protein